MSVPDGTEYTSKARGSVLKPVHCQTCGAHFVYPMHREASGQGTRILHIDEAAARKQASQRAQENLRQRLREECDPVPCPRCGYYQSQMTRQLMATHLRWLSVLGSVLVVVGLLGVPFTLDGTSRPLGLYLCPVGFALILGRGWLARRFDPNTRAHSRAGRPGPGVTLVSPAEYQEALRLAG